MSIMKQREDFRPAVVVVSHYNPYQGWMPPSFSQTGPIIGSGQVSYLSSYKMPRVWPFSLNPVIHKSFEGSSSPASCILLNEPDIFGRQRPEYKLEGDIAAAIGGVTPVYPDRDGFGGSDQAVIRAAAKLLEPDVGYGLMLAEASETIKLLTSPFSALPRLVKRLRKPKTLKRKKNTHPQTPLHYAADAWLQYRYAIMPTISDASDIVRHVTKGLTPPESVQKVGGGVTGPQGQTSTDGVACYAGCWVKYRTTTWWKEYYVSHLFYQVVDVAAAQRNSLGMGLSQLPALAWELVPFSFVLDWAIDVGGWLNAIVPKPEYAKKGQTVSLVTEYSGATTCEMASVYPDISWAVPCTSQYAWYQKTYSRAVNPPLPGLPPVNASIMNLKRSADLASLAFKPTAEILTNLIRR